MDRLVVSRTDFGLPFVLDEAERHQEAQEPLLRCAEFENDSIGLQSDDAGESQGRRGAHVPASDQGGCRPRGRR